MKTETKDLLASYNLTVDKMMASCRITDEFGFLPPDPPRALSLDGRFPERDAYFSQIDNIGYLLPMLISNQRIEVSINNLPSSNWPICDLSRPNQFRLMLLLTMIEHAYFHEKLKYDTIIELMGLNGPHVLPKKIAVPLHKLSILTGIAPSMAYQLYSQWNYYRHSKKLPVNFENTGVIHTFTGTEDEKWFVLVHQVVDYRFAPAIRPLLQAHVLTMDRYAWPSIPPEIVTESLEKAIVYIETMVNTLEEMRKNCRPDVYFENIRKFYSTPRNIVFEGVREWENQIINVLGETGGQDPWKQILHAVLRMNFDKTSFGNIFYFKELRKSMSTDRRELIETIQNESRLRNYVLQEIIKNNRKPARRYNSLIKCLLDWMDEHFSLATEYVGQKGETHGTVKAPLKLLQEIRLETKSYLID